MKKLWVSLIVALVAVSGMALTLEQMKALKTAKDALPVSVRADTTATLLDLTSKPVVGRTTNWVEVQRDPMQVQMERQILYICRKYGVTAEDAKASDFLLRVSVKLNDAIRAASGDDKLAVLSDQTMLGTCFAAIKSTDITGVAEITNVVVTPVYGSPVIAFPITRMDVELVDRWNPPIAPTNVSVGPTNVVSTNSVLTNMVRRIR